MVLRGDGMKKLGSLFILSIVIVVSGCAMKALPRYDVKPASEYKLSDTKEGLSIAVYPILDEKESEKYFGTNLLEDSILAVMVTAENAVGSSSKTLFPKTFSFAKGQALQDSTKASDKLDASNPSDPKEEPMDKLDASNPSDPKGEPMSQSAQIATEIAIKVIGGAVSTGLQLGMIATAPISGAVAALIIVPAYAIVGKSNADATEIKNNLELKELRSKTLSAGKQTNGFVYFNLFKTYQASGGVWSMRVNAMDMKNEDVISFDFEINLDRLKNDDK